MPRRFQNPAVLVQQHQVGMPSHDLQHQPPQHVVAHLVHGVQVHPHDPVSRLLADLRHPGAHQLLAHQHAQRRRLQRVGKTAVGQVAPGVVRRRAKQQPVILVSRANHHHNGVPLRLGNPVHPPACQSPVQFPCNKPDRQSVHRHESFLLLSLFSGNSGDAGSISAVVKASFYAGTPYLLLCRNGLSGL